MKKTTLLILMCCMIAGVFTGCSTQKIEEEQTSQTTMIGNPWSNCDSIEEAEAVVGFEFGLPEMIAGNYEAVTVHTLKNELIEVVYQAGDSKVCIRKQKGEGQDISGDYNTYETSTESNHECGAVITESYNSSNSAIKQLVSYNGYSWSLVAQDGYLKDSQSDFMNQILEQK